MDLQKLTPELSKRPPSILASGSTLSGTYRAKLNEQNSKIPQNTREWSELLGFLPPSFTVTRRLNPTSGRSHRQYTGRRAGRRQDDDNDDHREPHSRHQPGPQDLFVVAGPEKKRNPAPTQRPPPGGRPPPPPTMSAITSQPRVILGPLTTTFTPPPQCSVGVGICSTCNVVFYGQTCVSSGAQDGTTCWPPTTSGALAPKPTLQGWGFYSPGIACPSGYTSRCSAVADSEREPGWPLQFLLAPGETAVGCCPPGFNCHNQNGQTCIAIARSTTISTVTCRSGRSEGFDFATIPNVAAGVSSLNIFAPMIQIAWRAEDRPPLSSSSRTTPSGSSTTSGGGGDQNTNDDGLPSNSGAVPSGSGVPSSSSPGGLSTPAIVGISVSVTILVLGAILGAAFVWWKKRRRVVLASELHGSSYQPMPGGNGGGGEAWKYGGGGIPSPYNPGGQFDEHRPIELPVVTARFEMAGSLGPGGGRGEAGGVAWVRPWDWGGLGWVYK